MKIQLIKGDITKVESDIIVNAANTSLLGGGGVDGAIHKAGGEVILQECIDIRNRQGGCKVGKTVYTTAGNLPSRYVIHTVGPRWNGGKSKEEILLRTCYQSSLELAEQLGAQTIAFPNISTGIYRFPKQLAAEIAISVIRSFRYNNIKSVTFVCFDEENYRIYEALLSSSEHSINNATLEFIRLFEEVFHDDWKHSKIMMGIRDEDQETKERNRAMGQESIDIIASHGTFIDPKVEDETEDWGNRGALLAKYRELKKILDSSKRHPNQ